MRLTIRKALPSTSTSAVGYGVAAIVDYPRRAQQTQKPGSILLPAFLIFPSRLFSRIAISHKRRRSGEGQGVMHLPPCQEHHQADKHRDRASGHEEPASGEIDEQP